MLKKFNSEKTSIFVSLLLIFGAALAIISFSSLVSAVGCPPPLQFCGGVGIVVNPGGSSVNSSQKCGNNITSCGTYPNCTDLSQANYCVNGHVVQSYCAGNQPKNRTMSSHCTPTTNFVLKAKGHDNEEKQLTVTLFSPGATNNPILTSTFTGNSTIASTLPIADTSIDFDNSNLNIFMTGVNVTKLQNSGISNVTIDKLNSTVSISGVKVDKAYLVEFPSSFSFNSLVLKIKYSDVSVSNESGLVIYRCGTYNFATGNCDTGWELKPNVTRDTSGKFVSLQLTGFSVYSLAEPSTTSTTTTTSSSTIPESSSYSTPTETTSIATVGDVCNKSSDCCNGETSGFYTCTPGGCTECNLSQGNCYSCAQPTTTTTTTTTTTATTDTTTETKKDSHLAFSIPSFSLSSLSITQGSFITFITGFISGFTVVFLFKSGFSLPSFVPRYFGFLRSRHYERGYKRISNARYNARNKSTATYENYSRRYAKSFSETKLIFE